MAGAGPPPPAAAGDPGALAARARGAARAGDAGGAAHALRALGRALEQATALARKSGSLAHAQRRPPREPHQTRAHL